MMPTTLIHPHHDKQLLKPSQQQLTSKAQTTTTTATTTGTTTKVTKVRRTRQPRNPQLSVARRNERERNRVKMVNNGFALLREHLPAEDLQACEESGSDTPTPDGGLGSGMKVGAGGKAKKFSKVETLRAAIQRIKVLEELIRSTDPSFESIQLGSNGSSQATFGQFGMYDEEPLSVCEPLSCSSSHSNSTSLELQSQHLSQHHIHHQVHQQTGAMYEGVSSQQQEQFIKLDPSQQQQSQASNMPSPHNSQHSHTSGLNQYSTPSSTQVHNHHNHHNHHHHQHHQVHQHLSQERSHTQLWIQQHQSSFIEQQQQYHQQQHLTSNWYSQEQQQPVEEHKGNWFLPESESPEQANDAQQQQQQPQQLSGSAQLAAHQSPPAESSPVWFASGSSPDAVQAGPQQSTFGHHHHLQQISLYSQ